MVDAPIYCKECIIPDSFIGIRFENGVCSFCRDKSHLQSFDQQPMGKEKLYALLTSSKKESSYHCVVPISGGKDSSYILFHMVKVLGLNPLAVHYDSGFCSSASKENIKNITDKLSVELVTVSASGFHRKLIRQALLDGGLSGNVCRNCENMSRSSAIHEAEKRGIPFIVWGSTDFEDNPEAYLNNKEFIKFRDSFGKIKGVWYYASKWRYYTSKWKFYVFRLMEWKQHFYAILDNVTSTMPKGINRLNPNLCVSFDRRNTKVVYFYDYIKYDPFLFIEILKKEVNWQAPSGKESRMDCKLHCFVNYRYLLKHGITYDGAHLAVLVRKGLLGREEALAKEKAIREDLIKECQQVTEELKLDINLIEPDNR